LKNCYIFEQTCSTEFLHGDSLILAKLKIHREGIHLECVVHKEFNRSHKLFKYIYPQL